MRGEAQACNHECATPHEGGLDDQDRGRIWKCDSCGARWEVATDNPMLSTYKWKYLEQ